MPAPCWVYEKCERSTGLHLPSWQHSYVNCVAIVGSLRAHNFIVILNMVAILNAIKPGANEFVGNNDVACSTWSRGSDEAHNLLEIMMWRVVVARRGDT